MLIYFSSPTFLYCNDKKLGGAWEQGTEVNCLWCNREITIGKLFMKLCKRVMCVFLEECATKKDIICDTALASLHQRQIGTL